MAIANRKVKAKKVANRNHEQPFAEIDAKQLRRAQNDRGVKRLHVAADRHLDRLMDEGRIDL